MATYTSIKKCYHTFKPFIQMIIDDLSLQAVCIRWRFKPMKTAGGICDPISLPEANTINRRSITHYIVSISTLEEYEDIPGIIAHELRHVWQFHTNVYTFQRRKGVWYHRWKTERFTNDLIWEYLKRDDYSYARLPWEQDANHYAFKYRTLEYLTYNPETSISFLQDLGI